jgi:hypothetical protein
VSPEVAAHCQTFQFQVTMRAKFDKMTAGNAKTQEYKDWVNALFAGVRERLGD